MAPLESGSPADPSALPCLPDRRRARVVVGLDLGTSASGFSYFIRPADADEAAAAAGAGLTSSAADQAELLQCSPADVQPIQAVDR